MKKLLLVLFLLSILFVVPFKVLAANSSSRPSVDSTNNVSSNSLPGATVTIAPPDAIPDYCTFNLKWGTKGTGNGQFDEVVGITVDSSNNIYTTDWNNNRVQKFTSTGAYITQWGTKGSGNGQFDGPVGIAVDSSGKVYVTDSSNNRIQKFTSTGSYITQWGTKGTNDGQFDFPAEIVVDSSGRVFVGSFSKVQIFSSTGEFINQLDLTGLGSEQINNVPGLTVDSSNNVYIADYIINRVQKFSCDFPVIYKTNCFNLTGPTTLTVGQTGTFSANFSSPQTDLRGRIGEGNFNYFADQWKAATFFSLSGSWTPTTAGTYLISCRAWNDSVAECRYGGGATGFPTQVDTPPRYPCVGPNNYMIVTVTADTTSPLPTGFTLKGDFNGDGQLDIKDVTAMLGKWTQPIVTLTGTDLKYDLVGNDGKLTINDVVYLLGLWKTAVVK